MATLHGFIYHTGTNKECDFTLSANTARPVMTVAINTGAEAQSPISGRTYGQQGILAVEEDPFNPSLFVMPTFTAEYVSGDTDLYNELKGILESNPRLLNAEAYFPPDGKYGRFWMIGVGFFGSAVTGWYEMDYNFDNVADYKTAYDNGQVTPISETCYFDVYINGSDKPNIWCNWTVGESISPVVLDPRVWVGVQDLLPIVPEYITNADTGLKEPNTAAWYVKSAGDYSYAGSYQSTYLSIQQAFEPNLNAVSKLEHWGFDGDPAYVKLYLQMIREGDEGLSGIGELFAVTINKDGTASAVKVSGSSDSPGFFSVVRLHYTEPDYVLPQDDDGYNNGVNIDGEDGGRYDPNDLPDPTDFTTPIGFDGNAVLTKTYAVSAATLQNIGQKLWSQDYFNVLKIQNNPIENIVSVKHFPFAMTGSQEEVKIGDIAFGINGDKVASVQHLSFGSFTYTGVFKNYLDLQPFTTIKINLPYCGIFELNPADLLGSKLGVDYYIDLVTGQCMAKLKLDENNDGYALPFMTVYGQMGVDIPLTGSDRIQTELRAASAAVSAIGSTAGHILGENAIGAGVSSVNGVLSIAGMDYTSQRTSSQSPACTSFASPDIYLIIERPAMEFIEADAQTGYKHLHGYPCNKYKRLDAKKANGKPLFNDGSFVAMDKRTDIQFAMTADENRMLEDLLTKGVYI